MTTEFKKQVQEKLEVFVTNAGSQNKAATAITGVSSALLSQIKNNNWELISDAMWRTVAAQIGMNAKDWVCVETTDYKLSPIF